MYVRYITEFRVKNWSRERGINICHDHSQFVKSSVNLSELHNKKCGVIYPPNAIRCERILKGDQKRYHDNDKLSNTIKK